MDEILQAEVLAYTCIRCYGRSHQCCCSLEQRCRSCSCMVTTIHFRQPLSYISDSRGSAR
ncbi:hypothetical protein PVAP13_3KG200527 [Panicum virgatum]|uniref:Uncharacterized protein n=1 Tax=Panicum virgatum TaxID=38727 RepID=A0A8T0UKY7_PANVG|nr:hypothetical protein PVAP13_3KG200527 [Panicum virgatum]